MNKKDVLKQMSQLGYVVVCDSDYEFIIERPNRIQEGIYRIHFDKQIKWYTKSSYFERKDHILPVSLEEHQLIHNLMELWGWLND